MTESWLSTKIPETATALDGFAQFRNDRSTESTNKTKGGGLLVYVSQEWSVNNNIIHSHCDQNLEMLTINIRPHWLPREIQNIVIVSCYCPQTGDAKLAAVTKATTETITNHINSLENKYSNAAIIVLGDFNSIKLKLPSYQQVVTQPTRQRNILDKCYVSIKNAYPYCKQLGTLGGSDHQIMQLLPRYKQKSKYKPKRVPKRQYTEEACEKLKACFETTNWDTLINQTDNINNQVDIATDYINFCTQLHIPTVMRKVHQNSKPWINNKIMELVSQKHQAKLNGNTKLKHKMKKEINREMIKAKKKYTTKIQTNLAKDPAKAWTDVKKLSGLTTDPPVITPTPIYSPDELNNFFLRFEKSSPTKPNPDHQNPHTPITEFQTDDVRKLLSRLNSRKGAGPDHIIPRIMKLCAEQLAPITTQLFNSSISQMEMPNLWKTAEIRPLPKCSQPQQMKDYRPIALTSCLGKTLERLIHKYVSANTELDPMQFAYRAHRSTQDAVLELLTSVTTFIDARVGNLTRCLLLDFSSAFNTINVARLVEKIKHLDPKITTWIASFLSNRTQYTKCGTNRSLSATTNTGTPQGTVLSPLLFSIYTDTIRSSVASVKILKYADDTVLLGNISVHDDFENYCDEISRICAVCTDHELLLNASKTKEIVFTTSRETPDVPLISISNHTVPLSDSVKYLGVEIDSKLRFSEQADVVSTKCKQRLYIIKRFIFLGAEQSLVNQIFRTFIESYIFYCAIIYYHNMYEKDKKCFRKIYSIANYMGANVDNIDSKIQKRFAKYAMTIFHDDNHPIHQYYSKLPSGRLCAYKSRCSCGKNSFIRHFINHVNTVITGIR